jgi:hypothetical protein
MPNWLQRPFVLFLPFGICPFFILFPFPVLSPPSVLFLLLCFVLRPVVSAVGGWVVVGGGGGAT